MHNVYNSSEKWRRHKRDIIYEGLDVEVLHNIINISLFIKLSDSKTDP